MTLVALPPPPSLWKRRALVAGISALALAGMYTLGRYGRPDRTVETATVKQDTKTDAHVEEKKDAGAVEVAHRVIIKRKRPAPEAPPPPGCPPCAAIDEEETHEDVTASSFDHGTVATDLHVHEQAEETHNKVTENRSAPHLRVSAGIALGIGRPLELDFTAKPKMNAEIEYRAMNVGPLSLRAYGKAEAPLGDFKKIEGEIGARVALEF